MKKLDIFHNTKPYAICVFLTGIIFVIDLNIPLGVAGGVPYITVVLIALWTPRHNSAIIFAIICSIMTLIGFYFSPSGGELWKVIFNRALALFAIWVTAFLATIWKREKEKLFVISNTIEKEKEKIYLATIHSSQHIINNLLNQLQLIKMEVEEYPDFPKETIKIFDDIIERGQVCY
jgi:hypothetical protein